MAGETNPRKAWPTLTAWRSSSNVRKLDADQYHGWCKRGCGCKNNGCVLCDGHMARLPRGEQTHNIGWIYLWPNTPRESPCVFMLTLLNCCEDIFYGAIIREWERDSCLHNSFPTLLRRRRTATRLLYNYRVRRATKLKTQTRVSEVSQTIGSRSVVTLSDSSKQANRQARTV